MVEVFWDFSYDWKEVKCVEIFEVLYEVPFLLEWFFKHVQDFENRGFWT